VHAGDLAQADADGAGDPVTGVVAQLATATGLGAVVGAAVVYGYARWTASRAPRIRWRRRPVSAEEMRRLTEAFTAVRPPRTGGVVRSSVPPVGESGCALGPEVYGPVPERGYRPTPPPRYTYVRGPVRNRDTECQGADFSQVMAHLNQNLADHAKQDGLSPVATAVFLSRGWHAPGERCPSDPGTIPHDQACPSMYDDDATCTCPKPAREP
jgi:hypothetical protein